MVAHKVPGLLSVDGIAVTTSLSAEARMASVSHCRVVLRRPEKTRTARASIFISHRSTKVNASVQRMIAQHVGRQQDTTYTRCVALAQPASLQRCQLQPLPAHQQTSLQLHLHTH